MSHTATGEWKSFEIRMVHRRAERLVLRAHVEADAGRVEDARASLEEARTLWPAAPGIAEVQQKIDGASLIPAQAPVVVSSKWKEVVAAAAAVLFVCTALAVLAATALHRQLSTRDGKAVVDIINAPTPEAPIVTSPPPSPPTDTPLPSDTVPQIAATSAIESPQPIDTTPMADAPVRAKKEPAPEVRKPGRALPAEPITEPRRTSFAPQDNAVQPEPPAPRPVPASAPPAPAAVSIPGIVPTTGVTVPVSPSASIQPPQEVLVRSALAGYARAYSDLDVEAAERVWPSVNRSALERAFGSLESQRVSLGDCRIQVDVATAHASCSGTATWKPKIGGRERTDDRRWDFELVERSASGWQITSARVQNR
jgi:hypothetical protein